MLLKLLFIVFLFSICLHAYLGEGVSHTVSIRMTPLTEAENVEAMGLLMSI
jgi:hypothetical protein